MTEKQKGCFFKGCMVVICFFASFFVLVFAAGVGYYFMTVDEWKFRFAAKDGEMAKIKRYLKEDVDINAEEPATGFSALIYAIKNGVHYIADPGVLCYIVVFHLKIFDTRNRRL